MNIEELRDFIVNNPKLVTRRESVKYPGLYVIKYKRDVFFKNLWNKAIAELDKLGDNPKQEDITKWISTNTLNPADDSYMFKQQMEEFKKRPEANDQDCLTLVDGILNPETGALGKQGLQPMMDALKKKYPPKKGEPMHWLPADTEFIFQTIRNTQVRPKPENEL